MILTMPSDFPTRFRWTGPVNPDPPSPPVGTLVRHVMSSPAMVVHPDTPWAQAAALLTLWQHTTAPVIDLHGGLVGMVTDIDLIRAAMSMPPARERAWQYWGRRPDPSVVGDVLYQPEATVTTSDELWTAEAIFENADIRCLPVLEGRQVVGVLSRRDLRQAPRRSA